MDADWICTTIGKQVLLQRGIDITRAQQRPGRVPVVSSGGISSYHDTAAARGPGVVLGRKGVVGSVYFINEDYWPHDTTLWVKDFRGNHPRFVYYFFKQRAAELASLDVGSANPTLNRNHVHPITVSWPPIDVQHSIAHILGTLDDTIELNRRMNETLEEMARALFKSWFVNFDPVRAKAEGREPSGMDAETAKLFPSEFEMTEQGRVPKGWRWARLEECARRVAMGPFGSDIKTDNFVPEGVPIIRGGNLTRGFIDDGFVFLTEEKADQLKNANAFPDDIVITHRGTLGQVGMIPKTSRFPRYVVSQSQLLVSIDPEHISPRYVYEYLRSSGGQHALLANTSQTGVPAISRPASSVKALRVLIPPIPISRKFELLVGSLVEAEQANTRQMETLSRTRDLLLPALLSGSLSVGRAASVADL